MHAEKINKSSIAARPVPPHRRASTLANVFGRSCVFVQDAIFNMAGAHIEGYGGAFWDFIRLSNGGFYMRPCIGGDERVKVSVPSNYYSGEMSTDAAGIFCCLMTYSQLSFSAGGSLQDTLAEQFHKLRDFALDHPEASQIFAAID